MAVSKEPRFVPGIWGPHFNAMIPGLWLNEGGQSATGALIDHVIDSHARGAETLSGCGSVRVDGVCVAQRSPQRTCRKNRLSC